MIDARSVIGIWDLTDAKNAAVIPILPLEGVAIHLQVNANVYPESLGKIATAAHYIGF